MSGFYSQGGLKKMDMNPERCKKLERVAKRIAAPGSSNFLSAQLRRGY
jgi:hypothetical protein